MSNIFVHLTTLSTILVLGILIAGLWTMARGTNHSLSQKLMRWRVGLQFVAVLIIMTTLYISQQV